MGYRICRVSFGPVTGQTKTGQNMLYLKVDGIKVKNKLYFYEKPNLVKLDGNRPSQC